MPNAKPVELAPNAGLVGVTKLVVVVTAAAPKVNGDGAGFEAVVDDAPPPPPPPNGKGLGGCDAEGPNVVCVNDEPNTDCVVGA